MSDLSPPTHDYTFHVTPQSPARETQLLREEVTALREMLEKSFKIIYQYLDKEHPVNARSASEPVSVPEKAQILPQPPRASTLPPAMAKAVAKAAKK